ncbi:helix-turn-helix domain-containing protein [Vibrio hippocampi]|uniref:HTH-type transcriptional activator RhaS n=1 Tax=Vibrio hippocampi TaxID=654686 RepID=A0ABN8DN10_9VIBR|nr:helix-turn-helix domain-containing protein [Vibrio hippocampi]CAH0529846.1 HTH-type transcriptional activator RhaS [Vibrio hippocampi]
MSITYQLKSHQRYNQLKFAYVDGHHQCDFALHKHDFAELFLVVSGSGTHTVAKHEYSLNGGDVFVIKGDVEHSFTSVDELKIINLMFDADTPFFETLSMRQQPGYQAMFKVDPIARQSAEYRAMLTLSPSQLASILELMAQIKHEYLAANSGFDVMLTSLLQQLVISLVRLYQQQNEELPQTTLALSRALVFVEQNFADTSITSSKIAQAAYISKRQLERLFRQFLNTSPNHYLRDMQLEFARQLLCGEKKATIQDIAERCGYSDSNYFSKCFKQKFLVNPRNYRQQFRT